MSEPQISIVAVGRNDDYGGDFRSRLQHCVSWSVDLLTRNKIPSEFIFVNYNPIQGEPIEGFVEWPKSNAFVTVRVITVPNETHAKVVETHNIKDVPVLEYVAKNVGIRRARGKYVLSMNPDILMDENIVLQLNQLSSEYYYRSNRVDYSDSVIVEPGLALYGQIRKSATTVWLKGRHDNISGFSYGKYKTLRFLNGVSNFWKRNTVYLEWILKRINITTYHHNWQFKYHSNACGDFMLMSRDNWNKLKGYKEASFISLHVDALMVIQAVVSGLEEHVFEHPIYHKQHERRFDAHNRLTEDQIKVYHKYNTDVETMLSTNRPIIYNDDAWGLGNIDLAELSF